MLDVWESLMLTTSLSFSLSQYALVIISSELKRIYSVTCKDCQYLD